MNVETLRRGIENAPTNAPYNTDIRGFWHHDNTVDIWLCAKCAGRLQARGINISPAEIIWKDENKPSGICIFCN